MIDLFVPNIPRNCMTPQQSCCYLSTVLLNPQRQLLRTAQPRKSLTTHRPPWRGKWLRVHSHEFVGDLFADEWRADSQSWSTRTIAAAIELASELLTLASSPAPSSSTTSMLYRGPPMIASARFNMRKVERRRRHRTKLLVASSGLSHVSLIQQNTQR